MWGLGMSAFEFLLIFLTFILGLAVSDLCVSLNRLLEAGGNVRWDWLSPMAATVALLKIITQWWQWFGTERLAKGVTFEMFFLLVVGAMLLFLVAAAALPDRIGEAGIDLRAYYGQASRRFWLLFAAQYLVINAFNIWVQMDVGGARLGWTTAVVVIVIPLAAIGLAIARNRALHTIALGALTALYLVQLAGHRLGG
jgi:hypothetical protein